MEAFIKHTGIVSTLDTANVDTDQIIAKQFLKSIKRTGFGDQLFYDWRYYEDGTLNKDFSLNRPEYKGTSILLTRNNFGCGSSREHAPIALLGNGVSIVLAESFARIFYRNAINIGLPALECPGIHEAVEKGDLLEVDVTGGSVKNHSNGKTLRFKPLPPFMVEVLNAGGLAPYLNKTEEW